MPFFNTDSDSVPKSDSDAVQDQTENEPDSSPDSSPDDGTRAIRKKNRLSRQHAIAGSNDADSEEKYNNKAGSAG